MVQSLSYQGLYSPQLFITGSKTTPTVADAMSPGQAVQLCGKQDHHKRCSSFLANYDLLMNSRSAECLNKELLRSEKNKTISDGRKYLCVARRNL